MSTALEALQRPLLAPAILEHMPHPSVRLSEVAMTPLMRVNPAEAMWVASHMSASRWNYYVKAGLVEVTSD